MRRVDRANCVGPNSVSITYLEAIREAQAQLLREDPRVFIYGQDIAREVRRRVQGHERSGGSNFPDRVLNTPISEDAMVGTAIGAAMEGMRPIVEMQFADFSSIALNQIVNNAGTQYWRTQYPVSDHRAPAVRRHDRQRAISQPEHGSDLLALSRAGRHDARHGGRRLHDADRSGRDR